MNDIGNRVRERLTAVCPDVSDREVALAVEMTPDAFSRSLSGERRFSSIELARIADHLDTDLHWLITGAEDPNRLRVAARHGFDHATGQRSVPGERRDAGILGDIALAYAQAYPGVPVVLAPLPTTVEAVRSALGEGFVRPFADRLEHVLGVDVIRVEGLSTAYSFTTRGHRVIAMAATGNWFRENWDLAHELGHLVLQHHAEDESTDPHREAAANAFVAELLMPHELMVGIDWETLTDSGVARIVWDLGISTKALAYRLESIYGSTPKLVAQWALSTTQRLVRLHLPDAAGAGDELTQRMNSASQRRFPVALQSAHLERIAAGGLGKATLAWMLDVEPDALEVDSPEPFTVTADEFAAAMGLVMAPG